MITLKNSTEEPRPHPYKEVIAFPISTKESKKGFSVEDKKENTIRNREDIYNDLHCKIWNNVSTFDLPSSYLKEVNNLMAQATLNVLTTIENIYILKEEAKQEIFDENERLIKFCESLNSLGGDIHVAVRKVADGEQEKLSLSEKEYIQNIKESLSKSHLDEDHIKGPNRTSWGAK